MSRTNRTGGRPAVAAAVILSAVALAACVGSAVCGRQADGLRSSYRLWSAVSPTYSALPSMLADAEALAAVAAALGAVWPVALVAAAVAAVAGLAGKR